MDEIPKYQIEILRTILIFKGLTLETLETSGNKHLNFSKLNSEVETEKSQFLSQSQT